MDDRMHVLLHELGHAAGWIAAGAGAVVIDIATDEDGSISGEAVAAWPTKTPSEVQVLAGLVGGMLHRPSIKGADFSHDDAQIRAASPELLRKVLQEFMPIARERLACVSPEMLQAMLAVIDEGQSLQVTADALQ